MFCSREDKCCCKQDTMRETLDVTQEEHARERLTRLRTMLSVLLAGVLSDYHFYVAETRCPENVVLSNNCNNNSRKERSA